MNPTPNTFGTLIENELDNAIAQNDDFQSQYLICSYATTQQVLLRASASKKVSLLFDLFKEIKDHRYMKMILNLLLKYFMGKMTNYLSTLDRSDYVNDVYLKDNDRSLDKKDLSAFMSATVSWFSYLDNMDLKLGIFLSLLSLCGNNIMRAVITKMKQEYADTATKLNTDSTIADMMSHSTVVFDTYHENFDASDPDVQLIYKRRKEWDDMITKYRKKVELSVYGAKPSKKTSDKKSVKKKMLDTRSEKKSKHKPEGKSMKKEQTKTKSTKKSKKGQSGMKDKSEIDYLQLLPIWITMRIFKCLDKKTLKIIKNVNKYWEFVVSCVNQEEKGRKKFDSWISSIQNEFGLNDITPAYPLSIKPQFRFQRPGRIIACDSRVQKALQNDQKTKPRFFNKSILTSMANNELLSLALPANNLQPFQRMIPVYSSEDPSKYIHKRPTCLQFDNVTIPAMPIEAIPFTSNVIEDDVDNSLNAGSSSFLEDKNKMLMNYMSIESLLSNNYYVDLENRNRMENNITAMIERTLSKFKRSDIENKKILHKEENERKKSSNAADKNSNNLELIRYKTLQTESDSEEMKKQKISSDLTIQTDVESVELLSKTEVEERTSVDVETKIRSSIYPSFL